MPPRKTAAKTVDDPIEPVMKEEGTLTFRAVPFYAVLIALTFGLAIVAFGLGILGGYYIWGRTPAAPMVVQPQVGPTPEPEVVDYQIPTEGFPSIGPGDAPITVVEFSDYQCPYCTRWHEETYQTLMDAYPGKIRFVYRNFPLGFHQNAMLSAQAALCAGDQDQYWAYHDRLFAEKALVNNAEGTTLEIATYVEFAADMGLDTSAFETCLATEKYKQFVNDDQAFALSLPTENGEAAVGGTPTFFINGRRLVGAYPFETFRQIIDELLAAM